MIKKIKRKRFERLKVSSSNGVDFVCNVCMCVYVSKLSSLFLSIGRKFSVVKFYIKIALLLPTKLFLWKKIEKYLDENQK